MHHGDIAGCNPGFVGSVEPHSEGLDHGTFCKRNVVRQFVGIAGRVNNRCPVDRGGSPEPNLRIKVVVTGFGFDTVGAWYPRLHAYPGAHRQMSDPCANLGDHPGRFVTENHGLPDDEVPDSAIGVVVNIAGTNSHGFQRDADIILAELLGNLNIAESQLSLFFHYQCTHDSHGPNLSEEFLSGSKTVCSHHQ